MLSRSFVAALFLSSASVAHAGDVPLRQPAPAWASKADLDLSKSDADAPALLVFDNQHRIEKGRLWVYSDTATRIVPADMPRSSLRCPSRGCPTRATSSSMI